MPTSRTWLFLATFGALGAAAGCSADALADGVAQQDGELGEAPRAAGIAEGSLEEEGVLLLANDRGTTTDTFRARAKLDEGVARAIVAYRTDAEGRPRWFASVDAIDDLPGTEAVTFQRLVADARANGFIEAPGFDTPALRLVVPDDLGRPPTQADVTVEAGFDGKTPDEVYAIVRGRVTNTIDESNERFVERTVRDGHKAFTLAVNNLFAPGSPHVAFASSLGATSLTMLGTMSSVSPTILKAEKGGVVSFYARGASGRYEPLASPPKYPVIMRAKIQLASAGSQGGVRVFYPAWSAKVLSAPTTTITEGGS